jgi:peptidoglycan/LPS O-acetylase OafA/YrhL
LFWNSNLLDHTETSIIPSNFEPLLALPIKIKKILSVSIFSYLYFFVIGIALKLNYQYIRKIIEDKFIYWLCLWLVYNYYFLVYKNSYVGPYQTNLEGILCLFILAGTIISFAFSFKGLSEKLLKHQDFSYGIYIYHMPIINLLVALNLTGIGKNMAFSLVLVLFFAILSWFLIEKKALKLKY